MPFLMVMTWDGATLDQYEAARKLVDWEGNRPPGGLFHVAAHDGSSLRVVDLWETPEQFQAFVDSRLGPGTRQLGIETQPQVELFPVHALYTPGYSIPPKA